MKHFGNISNLADVVTKQYVDDLMGGSHTPSATDTYSLGTQSLRYLAAHIKTLTVATLSSVNNNQILLSDAAPYNYYLGVNGAATKLASLTVTSLTANGLSAIADATDYSVSQGIVSAALTVNGGVHIAKKLHVGSDTYLDGNTQLSGVLNITGVTGYAQGIRIHPVSGTSSIWFGATNVTGYDEGMCGITLDSTGLRFRGTATASDTTPNDYLNILYGGNVGIGTSSPSYKFHVVGSSMLSGTTYLGSGTTYYLGNGAAASKLYSLTIGSSSSTQMSVTNGGVVTIAASTEFSSSSTAALKVSGGAYIGKALAVNGKKIYFGSGTGSTVAFLEIDSDGNLHTNVGFYSDSFVVSGGVGSSGSGGSGVNVNTYSQIQAGTATGVASENTSYVPTAYALRQVYNSLNTLSNNLSNYLNGASPLSGLLLRNTNNSPTITFQGAYDGSLGTNVTFGTLSGYRATISSTTYTGLSVGADLFIPNGKHLYTYNYNGAPRSIAYYATSNYNYLQLGDASGVTNIKGSSVQINDSTLGAAAFKGVATSISSSSTDSNLATAKAVYDGCLPKYSKTFASGALASSTTDKWWRIGSVSTASTSIELVIGNTYTNTENGYLYFNISQGYSNTGIGQINYIITQTGGASKYVKGIRLVYNSSGRGSGNGTAYIEVLVAANSTNPLFCQATTGSSAVTWLSTPTEGLIGASSASSSYTAVTLYTSRGLSTSGGFDCTWLFALSANASIGQSSASAFRIPQFLNALATGTPLMWVTESVTINSVAYTMRYDVHVGKRGTAGLMLYYYNCPNSGTVEMNCIEIGYSSGWKVTAKYTKTL